MLIFEVFLFEISIYTHPPRASKPPLFHPAHTYSTDAPSFASTFSVHVEDSLHLTMIVKILLQFHGVVSKLLITACKQNKLMDFSVFKISCSRLLTGQLSVFIFFCKLFLIYIIYLLNYLKNIFYIINYKYITYINNMILFTFSYNVKRLQLSDFGLSQCLKNTGLHSIITSIMFSSKFSGIITIWVRCRLHTLITC